jgi:hypothetical protein
MLDLPFAEIITPTNVTIARRHAPLAVLLMGLFHRHFARSAGAGAGFAGLGTGCG